MVKRKIYITSLHLMHGGVEMAITALSNALVARDYDVEILCTYDLGTPAYSLDRRVKISYLTDVHPNREEFAQAIRQKKLLQIIREGVYALRVLRLKKQVLIRQFRNIYEGIIISTRNEDSVLLSKYGQKNVIKIAQLHHDHGFSPKLIRDFAKHYKNIDTLTVLTEQLQQEISEIMKNNTHTQCVAMPNFLPPIRKVAEKIEIENQAVAVGRLDPVKGFARLICMWEQIYKHTGTVLKIIGGGAQREELEAQITKRGLTDGVILTGPMDHDLVLAEMRKSQFYAMTSHNEGFGFVIIEAMAQGLPVIAFDVRVGPRAIINEDRNGYLIADGDEEDFINKAIFLITDKEKQEKMSKEALLRAEDFSQEKIMEKWEQILCHS